MLDERKAQAINGEDFETAKALKVQIERLKQLVSSLDPENPFAMGLNQDYSQQQQNMYDE